MEQEHKASPPDLVWKLVFPFLEWKELLTTVDLVCKRWRRIAATDEVWHPYCDAEMTLMQIRRINVQKNFPDDYDSYNPDMEHHIIMLNALQEHPRTKSDRDIFILSNRMGKHYDTYQFCGPDVTGTRRGGDPRSLRRASLDDLEYIVLPTIQVLRSLFGKPQGIQALQQKREMKNLLLDFARKDPNREAVLQRESREYCFLKEDLAKCVTDYLLGVAILKSKHEDDCIFDSPSSTLSAITFGEMIGAIGHFAGKELAPLQMKVMFKHTPQGFEQELSFEEPVSKKPRVGGFCGMDWPLHPSDTVHFLIKKLIPEETYEEEVWNQVLQQWWHSLAEPIRETLIDVYRRNGGPLPEIEDTVDTPLENVRAIAEWPWLSNKLEQKIWNDMETDTMETLVDIFLKKTRLFLDAIRREYSSVYGDRSNEMNAKILLELFLEVAPHPNIAAFADMTTDYCRELPNRMEGAFSRWNELIEAAETDNEVLWNPQTLVELGSLTSKFNIRDHFDNFDVKKVLEFDVDSMVTKFLYSVLVSENDKVPQHHSLRSRTETVVNCIERMIGGGVLKVPPSELERQVGEWQREGFLSDFTTYKEYAHVREHAMLALIPLLQYLSSLDSKKLVYAVFIQRDRGNFSDKHFGKYTFEDLPPCGHGQDDLSVVFGDAYRWIKDSSRARWGRHDTLLRLFGLPLPKNIVAAMADFLVERLYQHDHPFDVNWSEFNNALGVLPFMERAVDEAPENAPLVWRCLERVIQNAIHAVEGFNEAEIGGREREIYTTVIIRLVGACIRTRALRVVPTLRNIYGGPQFAILTADVMPLETLVRKLNEAPPLVLNTQALYCRHY